MSPAPEPPRSILVVEDDPKISDVLEYALHAEGYEVALTRRGREAVELCRSAPPCAIILDVGLPDIDGFEVCRQIRGFSTVPIIFLTSKTDEINRVVGLEIGGDDYVSKPFSTRELTARIKAIRRRREPPASPSVSATALTHGPLAIDPEKMRVLCHGDEISLTRQEFRLLELLASHPGRVFTREQVLDRAWSDGGVVTDRTIDVHIKSLRKKLADAPDAAEMIETVRGVGYRMREI